MLSVEALLGADKIDTSIRVAPTLRQTLNARRVLLEPLGRPTAMQCDPAYCCSSLAALTSASWPLEPLAVGLSQLARVTSS